MSPYPYTGVAGGAGWLESRDDNTGFMPQGNFNRSRTAFNSTQFANQRMFFNELKFSAAKSIRTSAIILASFNIIAAFATALGILCESYFRKKRNDRNFRFWYDPEAETFPLVLSVGIFFQGFIFAGVQSRGLDSPLGRGCIWIAQLMLPAVFVVPYSHLVFGAEIAIRALQKKPFAPRGKYNVSICLSILAMLLLANFLVADFDQPADFCITSLFWFISHYSVMCFGLLVAIVSTVLASAVTVFLRLHRSIGVEVTARVAASRMVYFLVLGVISNSFMIPFFFVQGFRDTPRERNQNAPTLAMIASVAANVSGLMNGGLYLFLKSSTSSTVGPRNKAGEYENRRDRYKVERQDSNDPDDNFDGQLMNPVTGPRGLRRMGSEASLITTEKEEEALDGRSINSTSFRNGRRSPDSMRSNRLVSAVASVLMPKAPEPARIPQTTAGPHMRKRSYSLFPRGTISSKASLLLPATTYSPADNLKPPPSMANLSNMRHRRDSSLVSSATVQIGIRLSSVDDMPPLSQNKIVASDHVVHTLGCPNAPPGLNTQSPKRAGAVGASASFTEPVDQEPQRDPVKAVKMKTLPPVPKINSQVPAAEAAEEEFTLSPKVYSPSSPSKARLPSPKGVGFSVPEPKGPGSPPRSPPRRRGTGETTPPMMNAKGDWI
ncbi:hypothetical protein CHGG_02525 [Chaetomium globosum CBS 148.51]|uniref:Uncharacterized protein n=1 Tax=Chaetomium globosum (strain ATCC 6205 / CBS 148.51 / DSM 1962 / NBRC 6347 / NRRL 1970) TaxID=306901 RepID=Q2HB79_CHAGB|nr:uncharacterized protein CHGG_02525 [Chaetomium globosum CBS 148.51]EAQ90590.1 hypothetical protein CHGG_02525 [Chaetomium globosum CBS 148.51]